MAPPETKLSLKFMVDSKSKKVIFAEAGSEFVDVLLSFLTLPLGTIIRQLNKHDGGNTNALGCFNNLYSSVINLSDSNFVYRSDRQILLHPKNASQPLRLKLNVDDSEPIKYYTCSNSYCSNNTHQYCAMCSCGHRMTTYTKALLSSQNGSVFTNSKKSFIVTDDLRLMPSFDGLNFELLQDLAGDVDHFDEKAISVGLNEIVHLLKWSLLSAAPLTNFLHWHLKSGIIEQPSFRTWAPKHEKSDQLEDSGKIVIKSLVQKSTNKLIVFLVGVEFVGFLFKLLTLPLGSTVLLLGGNSDLGSIDNLYTSVLKLSSEYFVSSKDLLISPKVCVLTKRRYYKFVSFNEKSGTSGSLLIDLARNSQIIERPSTFIVTDDLIVTPSTTLSIMAHLQSRKIHVSDVKELTINIGSKEALDILKASLTSNTSVLSNALQLMKQPKQARKIVHRFI